VVRAEPGAAHGLGAGERSAGAAVPGNKRRSRPRRCLASDRPGRGARRHAV